MKIINFSIKSLGLIIYIILNRVDVRYRLPNTLSEIIEYSRVQALKMCGAKIGQHSYVRAGAHIVSFKNLSIGVDSKIGPGSEIWNYENFIVGDNVEIGSQLLVHTNEHIYADKKRPLSKQGGLLEAVRIEDDVYVGARVTLLKGSHIESRCIIAAGAVVKGRLKTGGIYAGVPAKRVRDI